MIPVATAAEARAADAAIIEGFGVPGLALMELAGRALAAAAREGGGSVVVVAGPGNNGGDGWVAARWLRAWGVPVAVWPVLPPRGDAAAAAASARAAGVPEVEGLDGAARVIDALLGTGLDRAVDRAGPLGRALAAIAAVSAAGVPVIAADLPSGLDADTGAARAEAVAAAARTVTFGALKRGLVTGAGRALAGAVEVVDLGFGATLAASAAVVEAADVAAVWPVRPRDAHKRRAGHVLVVAGSSPQAGAAVLACAGALAGGAGLVTLAAPRGAWPRLAALAPEVMVVPAGEGDVADAGALPAVAGFDAVVMGPGLGGGSPLPASLAAWLAAAWRAPVPSVADADAIAALDGPGLGVLTPHAGEAARRLGWTSAAVEADRWAAVRALARGYGVTLLKGPGTLVDDGEGVTVNPTGGPSLATGGSGDVLAGLVGALLARGLSPVMAARAAAWVHGAAGDGLAGREGVTASQLAAAVPDVVASLRASSGQSA